jgi:hypothetical protein
MYWSPLPFNELNEPSLTQTGKLQHTQTINSHVKYVRAYGFYSNTRIYVLQNLEALAISGACACLPGFQGIMSVQFIGGLSMFVLVPVQLEYSCMLLIEV